MKVNFGKLLYQIAYLHPYREAVVNVERNRRWTYMEFYLLTNKIANMMKDRFKLIRGDIYLLILENDNYCLFHYIGSCFKTEAKAAFTNIRDSYEEHLWQIDFVNPKVVFIETNMLDKYYDDLRKRNIEIVCMDTPTESEKKEGVHYFWEIIKDASDDHSPVEHDLYENVLLRFTGGTTGKGKCVMLSIYNWLYCAYLWFDSEDTYFSPAARHLHLTPLSHGSTMFVLPTYLKGGTCVTINMPNLELFCETVQKEKITNTFLVPTLCYRLLDMGATEKYDLKSLVTVVYGGAPMNSEKLKILIEKFGNIFVQVYGASEAVTPVSLLGHNEHIPETDEDAARLNSCGKPTSAFEMVVMDDDGKEVADGDTGEIWIRGPGIALGYYKNPEETAKEFKDGWWLSGDIAYKDRKGYYYIVDRKKDMIISGGFNIYATEVEAALGAHPAVLNSAVVGIPHSEWGEAVHAEVILREGAKVSEKELITYVKNIKGKFKAPKSITFVQELPLSSVGKVLRRNVREKYWKDIRKRVS